MAYTVRTKEFEGPLEVLLGLIEKRKLHISVVSLAEVTDDFIKYLEAQEQFPLDESAHFVLVASTLLLIKSKSLLPTLELTDEEQGSIEDLEDRLKQYARVRELSAHVKKMYGATPMFPREENRRVVTVFSPDSKTTLEFLNNAVRSVLAAIPKIEKLPKVVVQKVISLEEMISNLSERITSSIKTSFKEFVGANKHEKVHVIVSFLALLELVKRGAVRVSQERDFDDIHLETNDIGVPKYN